MMRYVFFLVMSVSLPFTLPQKLSSKPVPEGYVIVEPVFAPEEITCLAQNIFYEALGEPILGKLAVATVTMNRVRHTSFPNTICEVVYQRNPNGCQFSWTCGARVKFNQELYNKHYKLAEEFLTKQLDVVTLSDALFFHADYVSPNWTFAKRVEQIGRHIFYEEV